MTDKIIRLNYIGSKYQLLEWLHKEILSFTGYESLSGKRIADLFAGTGIVSYFFRTKGCDIISNDAELYSYYVTSGMSVCFTENLKTRIDIYNSELESNLYLDSKGLIVQEYSPNVSCERMFFTVDNAKRIQYLRQRIEEDKLSNLIDQEEYNFLVASLLVSADNVSNVPAVYGCYLKKYKDKAITKLALHPIHTDSKNYNQTNIVFNSNISDVLKFTSADIAYLDPPYNERQYSKNYFPLNMIALEPSLQAKEILNGKTGIPESCFVSDFCKKGKVESAFEQIFQNLHSKYIFLSYSSESLISKDKMVELMIKYGEVSVVEKDYKKFKSFKLDKTKPRESVNITEYLFCLKKF